MNPPTISAGISANIINCFISPNPEDRLRSFCFVRKPSSFISNIPVDLAGSVLLLLSFAKSLIVNALWQLHFSEVNSIFYLRLFGSFDLEIWFVFFFQLNAGHLKR